MMVRRLVLLTALLAVVVGVGARFDSLEKRLFWQDESFSMLRVTGHVASELYALFDGREHARDAVLAIVRPDAARDFRATLVSLDEEPQRGPLFYLAARMWMNAFGDAVGVMRVFPALLGVAGIAGGFLLGRRIAGGALGGATLAALIAVAPVELRYSGQLREYIAIADTTLASAWLLLRAFERGSWWRWTAYGASVAIGLFVSPLFLTVVGAHFVAAIVVARADRRNALAWFAATACACVAFAPWFAHSLAVAPAHAKDLSWLIGSYGPKAYAVKWAFNVGAVFFDSEIARTRYAVVLAPLFLMVAFAIGSACVRGEPVARALALATTFGAIALVVSVDVLRHAHYEAVTRYLMVAWVGIDMLVAMMLARGFEASRSAVRYGAVAAFAGAIACGTFSAVFDRSYAIWWDDNEHLDEHVAADTIAANGGPALVVASFDSGLPSHVLVLARYLPADTRLLLYRGSHPNVPAFAGPIYFFVPQAATIADVREQFGATRTVRNFSPAIGLSIPDLRTARDGDASSADRADNALWLAARPASR